MEFISLDNEIRMPRLGMGGWAQKEKDIINAIHSGYRLLDTAAQYGNEEEVGRGIKNSGICRDDIFLTTKLWTEDIRNRRCREAFMESLKRLSVDYIDLYLIHWPAEGSEEAWLEMEKLYDEGLIKAIGVSNFQISHLEKLRKISKCVPVINQIEEHPYFTNQEVVDYCQSNGIIVEAWCPIGGPGNGVLKDELICDLAKKYGRTQAQIVLRWQLQRNIVAIPKTSNLEHMKSNLDIFDFSISEVDIDRITALNKNGRIGANPDNFDF